LHLCHVVQREEAEKEKRQNIDDECASAIDGGRQYRGNRLDTDVAATRLDIRAAEKDGANDAEDGCFVLPVGGRLEKIPGENAVRQDRGRDEKRDHAEHDRDTVYSSHQASERPERSARLASGSLVLCYGDIGFGKKITAAAHSSFSAAASSLAQSSLFAA
jgi:hypothetical protein